MKQRIAYQVFVAVFTLLLGFTTAEVVAQKSYEMLILRKSHQNSKILRLKDSFRVKYTNGEMQSCRLDSLLETGFLSKGEWIPFNRLEAIYVERDAFWYRAVLRPLGPSLLIFGSYMLLNAAGLAVIHGAHDWRAAMAFRNAMGAYGGGLAAMVLAVKFDEKKLPLEKYRINVF